jgi:hypothetical protein
MLIVFGKNLFQVAAFFELRLESFLGMLKINSFLISSYSILLFIKLEHIAKRLPPLPR